VLVDLVRIEISEVNLLMNDSFGCLSYFLIYIDTDELPGSEVAPRSSNILRVDPKKEHQKEPYVQFPSMKC